LPKEGEDEDEVLAMGQRMILEAQIPKR